MPKDVVQPGLIRLYTAPMKLVTTIMQIILVVLIFWILKDWTFTKVYELSGWAFAKEWASIEFLFWPTVIIAGLAILNSILRWFTNYYEVYPERLVIKTGVLSRYRRSIDMDQFAALEVMQGVWGRLCGYGDMVFMFEAMTTVVTKKGVVLTGVRQPDKLVNNAANYIKEAGASLRGKKTNIAEVTTHEVSESKPVNVAEGVTEPVLKTTEEAIAAQPNKSESLLTDNTAKGIQGEISLSQED